MSYAPSKSTAKKAALHDVAKIIVAWLVASSVSAVDAAQKVRVIVRVPVETPADASVYIAGSLPSVGNWQADGVKLARQPYGTFTGDIDLEAGQTLEFKITRGNWETVEKHGDGSDRANRSIAVTVATKRLDITVKRWGKNGQTKETRPETVVGDLRLHTIDSRSLKQPRTLRVWLPPGYDAEKKARYGVLYMHDGQNCFDRATSAFGNEWQIDETLTKLIRDKTIPPLIVVGIDNGLSDRINEYTYTADSKRGGGRGAAYTEFLLTEVKPFIDKTYRTQSERAHTYIGGSSLGGVISLEIARRHSDTFSGVIAMSPAIRCADEALTKDISQDGSGLAGARVWIDAGARETLPLASTENDEEESQRYIDAVRRLDAALSKHHVHHRFVIDDKHAAHHEPAWAARFPQAIAYILGENE